jgi:hypothetical protein
MTERDDGNAPPGGQADPGGRVAEWYSPVVTRGLLVKRQDALGLALEVLNRLGQPTGCKHHVTAYHPVSLLSWSVLDFVDSLDEVVAG